MLKFVIAGCLVGLTTSALAETARSAADFWDTLGVGTHAGAPQQQGGTGYDNIDAIIAELSAVHLKHVRDSLLIGKNFDRLERMHAVTGATFVLAYDYFDKDGGPAVVTKALSALHAAPAIVEAIEGPNEPDWFGITFNGADKVKSVIAAQNSIYDQVRNDPLLTDKAIYCPSLSNPNAYGLAGRVGDLSAFCDFASAHPYMANKVIGSHPPYDTLKLWTAMTTSTITKGRPVVVTETGWTTCPQDGDGVDEATQANYMLALIFDAFSLGIHRTYIYELADEVNDPTCANSTGNYGLFRYNGQPKPAAAALGRLAELIGSGGAQGQLDFSVEGLPPSTGHTLLLQRGDGRFLLVAWNEQILWDRVRHRAIPAPSIEVTVRLQSPNSLELHDPLVDRPQRKWTDVTSVPISLSDHPVVLLIGPGSN